MGLSISEFARREGCSRTLVQRKIASKHLKAEPDGTVAADLVGTGWRKSNRNQEPRPATPATPPMGRVAVAAKAKPLVAPTKNDGSPRQLAEDAVRQALAQAESDPEAVAATLDQFIEQVLSGRFPDTATAEQVKECGLALKHVLDARVKAARLIEIDLAEAVIFETFRASRDTWLNWPSRVGPLIAADLGLEAERVTGILKTYVHQQVTDLGDPDPDFARPED